MDITSLQTYRQRWTAVEEIEKQEAREASCEQRWQQLNNLVGMAHALGISISDENEEKVARQRWSRLQQKIVP
jgi:hypothetical protein